MKSRLTLHGVDTKVSSSSSCDLQETRIHCLSSIIVTGTANYYTVVAGGKKNPNAAWVYKTPKAGMEKIAGHVAFWKGVVVKKK